MKPRIAITLGDPAGIGPEIVAKALRDPRVCRVCEPIVIGKKNWPGRMGRPSRTAGFFAIQALDEGLRLVRTGQLQALVTAPVSKESFRLADHGFPGHTEWLAAHCQTPGATMLMVSGPLRAILMTRHVPLTQVSKQLTLKVILKSAELGYDFIKRHVLPHPGRMRGNPRLVLCGLNPHAGDHGLIGKEELTIFMPALRSLKRKRIHIAGPIAADTVFAHMAQGRYDLALAAYHDQGMIPLKLYAPDRVVNVTLGLPL
jgi:4-hydroxythreonine-4-phosphate dehydrogenase